MSETNRNNKQVAWMISGMMLCSFIFGVMMFIPAEHRAQKIEEMEYKYRQRGEQVAVKLGVAQSQAVSPDSAEKTP